MSHDAAEDDLTDSKLTSVADTASVTDAPSVITPTQKLREKLLSFRFNDESTPSLRRSPRHTSRFAKFEDVDSELPTSTSPSSSSAAGPSRTRLSRQPSARSLKRRTSDTALEDSKSSPKKARTAGRAKSASPQKKTEYAPPEKYAHLKVLSDHLGEGADMLDVMFCGINPGQRSATVGHHFAHPTNHFWKCLHGSQLTERLLPASEDHALPNNYQLGLTNLVERPSAQAAELANTEFTAGVPALVRKIVQRRPRVVCFVGKAIWESFIRASLAAATSTSRPQTPVKTELDTETSVEVSTSVNEVTSGPSSTAAGPKVVMGAKGKSGVKRVMKKTKLKTEPFVYDLQPYKIVHEAADAFVRETLFFVVVSTSGLVAGYQLPEKIKMFARLKQRIEEVKNGTLDTSTMSVLSVENVHA